VANLVESGNGRAVSTGLPEPENLQMNEPPDFRRPESRLGERGKIGVCVRLMDPAGEIRGQVDSSSISMRARESPGISSFS